MKILLTIVCFLLSSQLFAQRRLPCEGGGVDITVDTITPLPDLIKRLERNWQFLETNKGYWIGYTVDMFSIAEKRDAAIQPLLNFIDTSHNKHARIGAIYSLHLIGIDSKIAGRFYEKFSNVNARKALLSALKYVDLQPEIVLLLVRDPHYTDIPYIFDIMARDTSDCWSLNNYLTRFSLPLPINQFIPDEINMEVNIAESKDSNVDVQFGAILKAIARSGSGTVFFENQLLKTPLIARTRWYFSKDTSAGIIDIKSNMYINAYVDYMGFGDRFQYYVDNQCLYICTHTTAKSRLINWWKGLSVVEKEKFNHEEKVETRFFYMGRK